MILVYDNLNIGDAISKGFKFGLKQFFKILGAALLIAVIAYITNMLLINYEILVTLITSYFNIFLTIYIMNLFRNTKKEPKLIIENIATEISISIKQEDKNINDNKDDNTFIL